MNISLLPIDVGFDLRVTGQPVCLESRLQAGDTISYLDQTDTMKSIRIDNKNGAEWRRTLITAGYKLYIDGEN